MKLPELIENLSNDGCTDSEAIEIASDLIKADLLKDRLGDSLDKNKLESVLDESKSGNGQERRLLLALSDLSNREKQCYLRHHVELRSFSNIALELGISKGAVQQYIERARKKMKEA